VGENSRWAGTRRLPGSTSPGQTASTACPPVGLREVGAVTCARVLLEGDHLELGRSDSPAIGESSYVGVRPRAELTASRGLV
jgi:hypothetical protein